MRMINVRQHVFFSGSGLTLYGDRMGKWARMGKWGGVEVF